MLIEGPLIAATDAADRTANALIGPHAVIHAVAAMREHLGEEATCNILKSAQLPELPSGERMIPETDVLRLHRWLALREPTRCFTIAGEAAKRTADYIIANRIPVTASWLLNALPDSISGPMLMSAIRRHAWTFVGAGRFTPNGGWEFAIDRFEASDPVPLPDSLFHWYGKVFEQLFRRLVSPDCSCELDRSTSPMPYGRKYCITRR
ncbi:bacteriochlorophyll 4-vinyl reductase [Erythrobacter rubeus]|uniref:Bacteriochlorophyll 4-vinyl reductase n=1 Tax=Erythrobacter rubeus TaxID=2760803 RepID=A0ABR8KMG9_9SPHN|nr:bacteriochlorophyll 4-vinyl reductase [Erythrobacter rubeus]MBD2840854.1 bacteriochlorophyll 4-vinyl reductase [Erythrobacter rubeus]